MSEKRFFVYTAILCAECGKEVYGRHTLKSSVSRSALSRGARENGGCRSQHDWFCSPKCKMRYRMHHNLLRPTK